MTTKKLLWISMYAPVSFASSAGSQTFNFYFKKFLADKDFEIRLISCGFYSQRNQIEEELQNVHHDIIYWNSPKMHFKDKLMNIESKFNPWNRNANMISNSDTLKILSFVKSYLNEGFKPDVVIMEWTPIIFQAKRIHQLIPSAKLVASEHDVTYISFERKSKYYKAFKRFIWKQKYRIEKTAELKSLKLCKLVLPHNSDNINDLINEGLERDKLMGLVPYFKNMTSCKRNPNNRDVLFFGAMARSENYLSAIWFIDNVMPLLIDTDVRFVVLGSNPPQELKERESNRIHITGFVDSVEPYFESAMCMVAPLVLGAGIKVKVIEGMSAGVPVLTNKIGIEGIHAQDKRDYFYCEQPLDYAKVIKSIWEGRIDVLSVSQNSKSFINTEFSFEKCQIQYKNRMIDLLES